MTRFVLEVTDGFEIIHREYFEVQSLDTLFALTKVRWEQNGPETDDSVLLGTVEEAYDYHQLGQLRKVRLRKVPEVLRGAP